MTGDTTVSVVLPAFNEEQSIFAAVKDFQSVAAVDEVIVVNNRSTDRTAEEARRAGARVIDEPVQGYGAALRCGLANAKGALIVLAEPDRTFIARDVQKLLAYADDFDVVCGTRTTPHLLWQGANMGLALRWGNTLVAKLIQVLYGGPSLSDCGCTLRLIHQDAWQRIEPYITVTGSHFLPEMVILSLRCGLRLIEVPVNYRSRTGESKITGTWKGTVTTGSRMVALTLRYLNFRPATTYPPVPKRRPS
jgi:glycosyltransferase involved in cell wall biosynthesis